MPSPHTLFKDVFAEIKNGSAFSANTDELKEMLKSLASFHTDPTPSDQIVAGLILNHLRIGLLIKSLEKRNRRIQFWFMLLGIAAAIGALAQVISVLRQLGCI